MSLNTYMIDTNTAGFPRVSGDEPGYAIVED